jgi:hypothetical protein
MIQASVALRLKYLAVMREIGLQLCEKTLCAAHEARKERCADLMREGGEFRLDFAFGVYPPVDLQRVRKWFGLLRFWIYGFRECGSDRK